ncbi:MAG: hypothetical protein ACTSU9_11585 [Promethearchaeota archaeon]
MRYENLLVIPVYHGKTIFAKLAREAFLSFDPDRVLVELPGDLKVKVKEAVEHLPAISIIGYVEGNVLPQAHVVKENAPDSDTGFSVVFNQSYTYIPVHPGDPMIEVIRLANEYGKQVEFIDLSVDDYKPRDFTLPDEEAFNNITDPGTIEEIILSSLPRSDPSDQDYEREFIMASRIHELMETGEKLLFIVGFYHWNRIREFLDEKHFTESGSTIVHDDQEIFNVHPVTADLIVEEIPYIEYMYELWRQTEGRRDDGSLVEEILKQKLFFFKMSEQYFAIDNTSWDPPPNDDGGAPIMDGHSPVEGTVEEDGRWVRVLREATRYEVAHVRKHGFDRKKILSVLFRTASMIYEGYYSREMVSSVDLGHMMQYLRNWSLIRNKLFPSLDQVALSAKGFVNEEYAGIILDLARMYPFPDEHGKYPTISHDRNMKMVGPNHIYLRSRMSSRHRSWMQLPIKRRPRERYPGQWRRKWGELPPHMCSFPPEDVVEENFFNHLRQKTLRLLRDKRTRVVEFKNSLLDGIAFKETLRHRAVGNLYVKETFPIMGKAGSVVIIFDPDEENERFTHRGTWWAEHDQESDMSYYGTHPEHNIIGPGIGRIELGGVVSIYPPMQIPDVWNYFRGLEAKFKKHEILLMAAIMFSREKYIPYVAKSPPRRFLEKFASARGRFIIHIPIWKLSREMLERVRYIHVLRHKSVRDYAKDFIFL